MPSGWGSPREKPPGCPHGLPTAVSLQQPCPALIQQDRKPHAKHQQSQTPTLQSAETSSPAQPRCSEPSSSGFSTRSSVLTTAEVCSTSSVHSPCWDGRKLNFIISLASALLVGSLEPSPCHSLAAVKVWRLKCKVAVKGHSWMTWVLC